MWILLAAGSALFAGIVAILAKVGLQKVDSYLATALRTVVVLVFAWGMVFIVGSQHGIGDISGRSLLFLVLSGLATGASWLCYFRALQIGDVNKVVPVDKSSVVLTILLAFLLLGEPIGANSVVGILLIAVGTYMMIERKSVSQPAKDGGRGWFLYAALSAVFASLTSILGKIGITDVESNLGTAIRTGVVLVMAWLIVFIQGKQRDIKKIDRRSWVFILLSGLATGLSWMCYYRALQEGPASVVVPIDKLSILVTSVFAVVFLKERMSGRAIAGLVFVVLGTLAMVFSFSDIAAFFSSLLG